MLAESNPMGGCLSKPPREPLNLKVVGGGDTVEQTEGEGGAGKDCVRPRHDFCLSICCLCPDGGGGGGRWYGRHVTDSSLVCASDGELG